MQSELFPPLSAQFVVMTPNGLKQVVGAGDVAFNEHPWTGNGAIHMAFCRQVHHQVRIGFVDRLLNRIGIREVDFQQLMAFGLIAAQRLDHLID